MFFRALLLSLFIYTTLYAHQEKITQETEIISKESNTTEEITQKELLSLLPDDKFLGDPNAPVIMIGYVSPTCYHCALFYKNELAQIKKKYIDTGKLLYVLRIFPTDRFGFKATLLSYCYTKTENYFNFIRAIFDALVSWNYYNNSDELALLKKIAALSNLKEDMFNKCINDKAIEDKVLNNKLLAINKLGVENSPTFFIKINNNNFPTGLRECKHEGHKKLEYFSSIIDKLYAQATTPAS
ncbi:protein-disulfide isomerase [Wolbachia pipientis]|uniref:Protein-disulfide isomerase n=1 Tax=Wolbachia pipientis TaxID=955 RepID=A0A1E7QKF5_WOLPI|nr:thioredoxin domain-containing protein [Wolbachia pipientis]OEY86933.1 protein-disulfide isomerase [Wolbachia pipientis]